MHSRLGDVANELCKLSKFGITENELSPCSEPICSNGCINGECRAPDFCTCEIGWEGSDCTTCIEKPGCQNGYCSKAFECKCEAGWYGSHCELRK